MAMSGMRQDDEYAAWPAVVGDEAEKGHEQAAGADSEAERDTCGCKAGRQVVQPELDQDDEGKRTPPGEGDRRRGDLMVAGEHGDQAGMSRILPSWMVRTRPSRSSIRPPNEQESHQRGGEGRWPMLAPPRI